MLHCNVLRAALSASFGIVVQIVIFLLPNSNITRVVASMPPGAEDEIILIEHLPGRQVHLQDFFWTGLEDAPPWVDPSQGLTLYETKTIIQTTTIYTPTEEKNSLDPILPHRPDPYNPECITCIEPTPRLDDDNDNNIGVLIGEDPGPRYWLLTVLRPGEAVPSKVELRLARLYRTAFSRQQQRHLGLLTTDPRSRRNSWLHSFIGKKDIPQRFGSLSQSRIPREETSNNKSQLTFHTTESTSMQPNISIAIEDKSYFSNISEIKLMKMIEVPKPKKMLLPISNVDATDDYEKRTKEGSALKKIIRTLMETEMQFTTDDTPITTEPIYLNTDTIDRLNKQSSLTTSILSKSFNSKLNVDNISQNQSKISSNNESSNVDIRSKLRLVDGTMPGIVKVRMQNTSIVEGGPTKLIYSVHLDDKPVPAETAARDMTLLSAQEVALELGAPVIIQSEPYLKESRPLALSRRRDAWLLIGAASAGIILLMVVFIGLILAAKRKRAHSAVAAPPNRSILKKEREYATTTVGLDNAAFSTSETEVKTDGTSQHQTPRTLSRTPITPDTPDSLELGIHEVSSDNDDESKKFHRSTRWNVQEHPNKQTRITHGLMTRSNAMEQSETPDSLDMATDPIERFESLDNGYVKQEQSTASPRSYLSMPSCKQFPSMRSVEPLSRVLEPAMARHLDIGSPELVHRNKDDELDDPFLTRTSSASKDPGVVGPIVWSLNRQILSTEDSHCVKVMVRPKRKSMECTIYYQAPLAVPEEDSTNSSRIPSVSLEVETSGSENHSHKCHNCQHPSHVQWTRSQYSQRPEANPLTSGTYTSSSSFSNSPVATPTTEIKPRPRTSLPRKDVGEDIPETGQIGPIHSRGAWGSRPLSAGPFHRPNLPEVDTRRILADSRLPPEDPAVPLIASIKKELEKFTPH